MTRLYEELCNIGQTEMNVPLKTMTTLRIGGEAAYVVYPENEMSLVCYVDLDTAKQLKPGMEAVVYLNSTDSGIYGYMEAEITNVDRYAASSEALAELLGADGQMAYLVTQNGPVAAVTCELRPDETTESGYYFSTPKGAEIGLSGGEQAAVQIIKSESAPIAKVFPMFRGN